ncbi:MAG: GNAT family N-acetyltransferase [Bacteroidota bacterium]
MARTIDYHGTSLEIRHAEDGNKGYFYVLLNNKVNSEMTYSRAGEQLIIIDHTEVGDLMRGLGTGKQLVLAAVDWARETGTKIMPLCPFAKSVFEKNTDLHDVLK